MMDRLYTFVGGASGSWKVIRLQAARGPILEQVEWVHIIRGPADKLPDGCRWALRGVTSNERYVIRQEQEQLQAAQPPPGRPEATCAALIPIKKSPEWWTLAQDERRAILETRSHHIQTGLRHVPQIARRLYHGYDLGEMFDFLTWFEFAPAHAAAFEELVSALRKTEEWAYVEREVDIRLVRK